MRTLSVALDARSYPIHIGTGLLADPGLILPYLKTKRVAVITNTVVGPLYLAPFVGAARAGLRVTEIVLPDGEAHKDWPTLNLIFDGLLGDRCDRSTTLIALGGGVVGDMVGFAAASYQRGCPSSRCPPRCCPRWIRRWAARRRSTTRSART
jgi:3-dehydroquinate synthase